MTGDNDNDRLQTDRHAPKTQNSFADAAAVQNEDAAAVQKNRNHMKPDAKQYTAAYKSWVFLSARWRHLILASYAVEPGLLRPHVPPGLELDLVDGRAFVSLVAFQFLDTRVLNLKIPFHVNFPEVNLRFYVRAGQKRGVCFIREIVPRAAVARAARAVYNEPYEALAMDSKVEADAQTIAARYSVVRKRRTHSIEVKAQNRPYLPEPDSPAHFFKEHEWGFGRTRKGKTIVYRVEHPHWRVYPVRSYRIDVDFGALYGPKWAALNGEKPIDLSFAEGSAVKVYPPRLAQ
ncbi:MAG: DUF2071 domain-containing protein [Bacteroidia bacterium]|nr:DUF2071 domain-containing protein [Bacteroidia bacterium]